MSLASSHSIESVTRLSCLPVEEKPKRHKFYKFFGKVGTVASTLIWVVDKETVNLGDWVYYVDENDHIRPSDKKCYMMYLSEHNVHRGVVDRINDDGYIFVTK